MTTFPGICHVPLWGALASYQRPMSETTSIRRFEPRYWTIDHPLSASASIVENDSAGFTVSATLRTRNCIVGVKWQSEDKWSPAPFRYQRSYNYTGVILEFDYDIVGLPSLYDVHGLVLSVKDSADNSYFVRLANYVVRGTGLRGAVRLNFTGAPVYGGYNIYASDQRTDIPWNDVVEMFIGIAAPEYNQTAEPLAAPREVTLTISNVNVTGQNTDLQIAGFDMPDHALRLCEGYDDAYNLTPTRIVETNIRLGYREWYVIYIGASHLHDLAWSASEDGLRVSAKNPVSEPSRRWFKAMFAELKAKGFKCVVSQSYEILLDFCPEAWRQRAADGTPAKTGWNPPSTLISPTNSSAMGYLLSVARWMMEAQASIGADLYYQIGEPWWWDGSYTNSGPCFYDDSAVAAYEAEVGPVPTPWIASINEEMGTREPYCAWLGQKLGMSVNWLHAQVKARFPSVTTLTLMFTPQILMPGAPMMTMTNFPTTYFKSSNFDILQLEDYDWVTGQEWELHEKSISAGTDALGFPLDRIHYFAGFNLNAEDAATNWPRIHRAAQDGFEWGVAEVHVWARPQVWRDGWLYPFGELLPAADIPSPVVPEPDPTTNPSGCLSKRSSYGDIFLTFYPNDDPTRHVYNIEIMASAESPQVVRGIHVVSPRLYGPFVRVVYPLASVIKDFGADQEFLTWRMRVDDLDGVYGYSGRIVFDDEGLVQTVFVWLGQSNAYGQFDRLSGASRDLVAANTFRQRYADLTGVDDTTVLPLNASMGSASADKLAAELLPDGSQENYWWDLDAGLPGPRLTEAIAKMLPYRDKIERCIWAGGETDVGATDPLATGRLSTPVRFKASLLAIFAYIRSELDLPDLVISFQVIGRAYWGDDQETAREILGVSYKAYRDIQIEIAEEEEKVVISSWIRGAEGIGGYIKEDGNAGWIHYAHDVYHTCAEDHATAFAEDIDRTDFKPPWVLLEAPTGIAFDRNDGNDIVVTWDAALDATWGVRCYSIMTGDLLLSADDLAAPTWTFARADQLAAYGQLASFVSIDVFRVIPGVTGPAAAYDGPVDVFYAPAPTGLAVERLPDDGMKVTWNTIAGAAWRIICYNVVDVSVIFDTAVASPEWTFTHATQVAEYGFTAGNIWVRVCRVVDGYEGEYAVLNEAVPLYS